MGMKDVLKFKFYVVLINVYKKIKIGIIINFKKLYDYVLFFIKLVFLFCWKGDYCYICIVLL